MDKKSEILAGAAGLYLKLGIKSVSMDDLARELGISKKTIYQFFTDKNSLVESVLAMKLNHDQETCCGMIEASENAIQSLINVISVIIGNLGQIHPSVFYDLQKYHQSAFKLLQEHQSGFVLTMIRNNIIRGQNEGLYRKEIDEDLISRIYVHMVSGIIRQEIQSAKGKDFSKTLEEAILFMINGLSTPTGVQYLNSQFNKA